ncbi:MAG: hypothetical protein CL678_16700 [Bdellovibrionaceae bacterium]|nr:hypothetical protein [Pseudobdellovibrionaceae bacterium]
MATDQAYWDAKAREFRDMISARYELGESDNQLLTCFARFIRKTGRGAPIYYWDIEILFQTADGQLETDFDDEGKPINSIKYEYIENTKKSTAGRSSKLDAWEEKQVEHQVNSQKDEDDKQYERNVGSRYHNILRLKFAEFHKKRDGSIPPVTMGVLDSYFYYTHPKTIKAFKKVAKDANTPLPDLIELSKTFALENLECFAITLLDGWSGFNKGWQRFMKSEDYRAVASNNERLLNPSPGTQLLNRAFATPASGTTTSGSRVSIIKTAGFYGLFGFINETDLINLDPALAKMPEVEEAFRIACFGLLRNAENKLICFKPVYVEVSIDGRRQHVKQKITLESNPARTFETPGTLVISGDDTLDTPYSLNKRNQTFYDFFRMQKDISLSEVLRGERTLLVTITRPHKHIPFADERGAGYGGGGYARQLRSAEVAFADLAL